MEQYRNDYYERLRIKLSGLKTEELERFFTKSELAAPFIVLDWENAKGKLSVNMLSVRYGIPRTTVFNIIKRHRK